MRLEARLAVVSNRIRSNENVFHLHTTIITACSTSTTRMSHLKILIELLDGNRWSVSVRKINTFSSVAFLWCP
jgi:hypothetical protein